MANRADIDLNERNDENVECTTSTNRPDPGTPLNLTGLEVEAFLKASAATPDTDAGAWKGSTGTGEVTITDAANGEFTVSIPGSAVTTTKAWWRADVLDGSLRKTAVFGEVTVRDL